MIIKEIERTSFFNERTALWYAESEVERGHVAYVEKIEGVDVKWEVVVYEVGGESCFSA